MRLLSGRPPAVTRLDKWSVISYLEHRTGSVDWEVRKMIDLRGQSQKIHFSLFFRGLWLFDMMNLLRLQWKRLLDGLELMLVFLTALIGFLKITCFMWNTFHVSVWIFSLYESFFAIFYYSTCKCSCIELDLKLFKFIYFHKCSIWLVFENVIIF